MATNANIVRFEANNYHEKLFYNFKLDDFTDVVLWAEDRSIRAHRCMLAAASEVFHKMLKICDRYEKPLIRK